MMEMIFFFFFFKQKTAYEMRISDWSSDVCSSDLVVHRRIAERQREEQHQRRAEREAGELSEFEKAAEEAAAVIGRIFGHEVRPPAIFAAGRETLDHAQQDQQRRRPEADMVVGGDQPDAEGGAGHQQYGQRQHRLAPDAVAERPPEQPAQRPEDRKSTRLNSSH